METLCREQLISSHCNTKFMSLLPAVVVFDDGTVSPTHSSADGSALFAAKAEHGLGREQHKCHVKWTKEQDSHKLLLSFFWTDIQTNSKRGKPFLQPSCSNNVKGAKPSKRHFPSARMCEMILWGSDGPAVRYISQKLPLAAFIFRTV